MKKSQWLKNGMMSFYNEFQIFGWKIYSAMIYFLSRARKEHARSRQADRTLHKQTAVRRWHSHTSFELSFGWQRLCMSLACWPSQKRSSSMPEMVVLKMFPHFSSTLLCHSKLLAFTGPVRKWKRSATKLCTATQNHLQGLKTDSPRQLFGCQSLWTTLMHQFVNNLCFL